MTLRIVTVADQLPDQDAIRAAHIADMSTTKESATRPVFWDGEEMGIDEACEVSFEGSEEREASQAKRHPIDLLNPSTDRKAPVREGATIDVGGQMQAGTSVDTPVVMRHERVHEYALPEEAIDYEKTQYLDDNEQLAQALEVRICCITMLHGCTLTSINAIRRDQPLHSRRSFAVAAKCSVKRSSLCL